MLYLERWHKPCHLQVIFNGPSYGLPLAILKDCSPIEHENHHHNVT